MVLQRTKSVSRDADLAVLITTLKQSASASAGINNMKELLNVALNRITINVVEELLRNEVLHLPVVHDQFQDYASNLRPFHTYNEEEVVSVINMAYEWSYSKPETPHSLQL